MKIRVENWYTDGHESVLFYEVDDDAVASLDSDDEEALRDFFFDYTGDGHGIGNDLGNCSDVTILEARDPALVGLKFEEYGL